MDFSDTPRRRMGESIVPMINVVFLLLIFFLMTAQIATPDPFEVDPPTATIEAEPESDQILYVAANGRLSFDGADGDAAIAAIGTLVPVPEKLQIRADADIPATAIAKLLQRLAQAGLTHVELTVVSP